MSWKTACRSFYYQDAPEPEDIVLAPGRDRAAGDRHPEHVHGAQARSGRRRPLAAVLRAHARDRDPEHGAPDRGVPGSAASSPSSPGSPATSWTAATARSRQKKPGFNYLLLPKDREDSQVVPELAPKGDEIVITKTTDSALTGTNLRLILHNMGIRNVIVAGIFTDQCVSSTVRSLADESFNVIVVEDCCAAATMDLHHHELEILNMIYCHVTSLDETLDSSRKSPFAVTIVVSRKS